MELLIAYKIIVVVSWFALVFFLERVFCAADYPELLSSTKRRWRVIKNLSISAINMVLSPLIIIPLTAFISFQFTTWRPEWMSHPAFFLMDLLLLDCFLYWWHRVNHRLPFLWRFHEVHHLDEFLDSTTALRFHFGEVFISAIVRSVVIIALGIPLASVIIFEIFIVVFSVFNHSNMRLPAALENGLSKFIVTPSIHWVHHHAKRYDTDSNYATIFSVWDHIFSSFSPHSRQLSMSIGVEGKEDMCLSSLLLRPINQ
ncbi:MAG: sterol desaturase/sphingolipid hydroxylase (fatty acid hydroxylase superfamily) [Candidatus Endobugula sp.]|jgi:sterol desaturase/sphingolipid hydroxylase (fatty acid hydroxylase superfamily)